MATRSKKTTWIIILAIAVLLGILLGPVICGDYQRQAKLSRMQDSLSADSKQTTDYHRNQIDSLRRYVVGGNDTLIIIRKARTLTDKGC